jgi:hypothetical protein
MKFRKKPVVIDAVQLTPDLAVRVLMRETKAPFGLHISGDYHPGRREVHRAWASIETLEGVMRAELNDWIIKGVKGELYPVKDEIFKQTYEAVDATQG